MPLKENEKETIALVAREFGVKKMWLFGSAVASDEYNDIDLAAEGVPAGKFFDLFSRLFDVLSKPVDVINMDGKDPMRHIVRDRGVVIYE